MDRDNTLVGERKWIPISELIADCEVVGGAVVKAAAMKQLFQWLRRVAPHETTVLVLGESGVGKELVARALHQFGRNPQGPFVVFNCSNLIASLAEAQLFGHVRGSFTDAREGSTGFFRAANGGTLFLDEVGDVPVELQAKLLRAVENLEVQPVGSTRSIPVDVRIVAATNHDLSKAVRAGTFRSDLFYRLNGACVTIPPLRERREEVGAFIGYFINHFKNVAPREIKYISSEMLGLLQQHDWPGNVRELAHVIENALMLCEGDTLSPVDLPAYLTASSPLRTSNGETTSLGAAAPVPNGQQSVESFATSGPSCGDRQEGDRLAASGVIPLEEMTRQAVVRSLVCAKGNRQLAARLLRISRPKLYRLLARYGLTSSRYRDETIPTGNS